MPNYTKNLGLTKPLPEEFYDVNVRNENWDKIDESFGKLKTTLKTANPDANKLTEEGEYFLLNGRNIPKVHGFVTVRHFDGNSFAPDLNWGRTHCIRQIFRDYNTSLICERFGLLRAEIDTDWIWGEWEEVPTTSKNITLKVPSNGGYRIKNSETGSASDFMTGRGYSVMRFMDEFDNGANYREIMLVGTSGSPNVANSVQLLDVVDGKSTIHTLYHTGNLDISKLGSAGLTPASIE